MKSCRALAALLAYPESELVAGLDEIAAVLEEEAGLPGPVLASLRLLLGELATSDLYDLQERYVALFDRSRALSLNLFEHVHGESRDRGQAMVDLAALYGARGLAVVEHELPDYLPALLEYCSLLEEREAKALIGDAATVLRSLGDGLLRRDSRYCAVIDALLVLAGEPGLAAAHSAGSVETESALALDREWAEEPVSFGAPCGVEPATQPVRIYRKGMQP